MGVVVAPPACDAGILADIVVEPVGLTDPAGASTTCWRAQTRSLLAAVGVDLSKCTNVYLRFVVAPSVDATSFVERRDSEMGF